MNIKFCIPSADNNNDAYNDIHANVRTDSDHEVLVTSIPNNRTPLPTLYNQCIDVAVADGVDWLVLCHNDLTIDSNNVIDRIVNSELDVIGVAGASGVEMKSPALWHLMARPGTLRGAVAHGCSKSKQMTSFGPYPARCVILDGVFLAIKRCVFEVIRFDENNPCGFHFYDLTYTLDCHAHGFKVGVGDIMITHQSPGLKEFTADWKAGEKWFLNR